MPDPFAQQLAVLMGLIQQKLAAAQLGQPTGPVDEAYNQPPQSPQGFWLRQTPQGVMQDTGIYGVTGGQQTGDPVWGPTFRPTAVDPQGSVASTYSPPKPGSTLSEGPSPQMAGREDKATRAAFEEDLRAALPLPGDWRSMTNFTNATQDLALTDQEMNLYQHHLNNLWGPGKVIQPNGDISTVEQTVVTGPDGKYYSVPRVWNGREVDTATAWDLAAKAGWTNWPSYDSPQEADERYRRMHEYVDKDAQTYRTMLQELP